MTDINNKFITNALEYASNKHQGQVRKDGTPYINHPIRVAYYVSEFKLNESLIISAILHDTLEDTDATYEEISTMFGDFIANTVLELTNDEKLKKEIGKEEYLKQKLLKMSNSSLIVKLCDRLDNVIDLVNSNEKFQEKYVNETINILKYIIDNRQLEENHIEILKNIIKNLYIVNKNYNNINKLNDILNSLEYKNVKNEKDSIKVLEYVKKSI